MINEHVNEKLGIVKVLGLLVGQVCHHTNLLKEILCKLNNIFPLYH